VVKVAKKPLGAPLRAWLRETRPDYWWAMEHSVFFSAFTTPAADLQGEGARWEGRTRHLRALEVYSGAGGTSAIAQRTAGAAITSAWSVDLSADACLTYAVNHPEAWVWHMGVEEWLALCVMWQHLWEAYREWRPVCGPPPAPRASSSRDPTATLQERLAGAEAVVEMRYDDTAARVTSGQGKGQLVSGVQAKDCWLRFRVRYPGKS